MKHYIDKAALVAKIEKIYRQYEKQINSEYMSTADFMCIELKKILSLINTIEVKEVDLEKEIMKYQREIYDRDTTVRDVAKYFFELGIKAQKGK